jgi:hypothetical protein
MGAQPAWMRVAGQTEEQALDNIRDAIRDYVAVAEELVTDGERREIVLQR